MREDAELPYGAADEWCKEFFAGLSDRRGDDGKTMSQRVYEMAMGPRSEKDDPAVNMSDNVKLKIFDRLTARARAMRIPEDGDSIAKELERPNGKIRLHDLER